MDRCAFFFRDPWNDVVDRHLIRVLRASTWMMNNYTGGDVHPQRLRTITRDVNWWYESEYPESMVEQAIKTLYGRYRVFGMIIRRRLVDWDKENNWVNTTEAEWNQMVEMWPLAAGYRAEEEGEEDWDDLVEIFGPPEYDEVDDEMVSDSSDDGGDSNGDDGGDSSGVDDGDNGGDDGGDSGGDSGGGGFGHQRWDFRTLPDFSG